MARRTIETDIFGRKTDFEYSERWVGYSLVTLRLVMGWVFFYAGVDKLLAGDWSARGYLMGAANREGVLLPGLWETLAQDYIGIVDPLNVWGLTLVGLALLLGAAVRWSALWGSVIMLFYYLSGYPLENSLLIDSHVVYIMVLFGLGAFGAGRILGVDEYLESTALVENNPWLRYLLG
ncbi:DoxX family membrane protein [Halapricum hydrolyticum]|uniref:DoxX family membrane protein n=1 Tax=Halapricum hydrolyticum TaxID=2979991 RepID=A0AAE3IBM2_9EURY|nr:DoxX family membrane protein [Halapricum hydrolyticum]MCU4718017.1 DoxX family membrane protein [Halapricum hydrolyticum]MCU4727182.1 DoxX family membrane protein [Halapricum hydrolyticum]